MNAEWDDVVPNWDKVLDVGKVDAQEHMRGMADIFGDAKKMTEALTDILVEETRAKDMTITKLQYVVEHLLRCIVSLHEVKDGLLVGGSIFLPSKAIPFTEQHDVQRLTTHVDWSVSDRKKDEVIKKLFDHMLKTTADEVAKNDERMDTLSQRFKEKMEEI